MSPLEEFLNSPDPERCEHCDSGEVFYVLDDDVEEGEREVPREEYNVAPPNIRERRPCTHCGGYGFL